MAKSKSKSKLGDVRLDRVQGLLIYAMSQKLTVVLRQLSEDRAEEVAFGRYIKNPRITPEKIVAHYHTEERHDFSGQHILVMQDTSTASFGLHANRTGLGYVGENTTKTGFDMHPALYMDAQDGACYGLGGVSVWKTPIIETAAQEQEKLERRKNLWKIPFEEKESYKWHCTAAQAIANNNSADAYTIVSDREADIYDLFALNKSNGWGWLTRASTNRMILTEDWQSSKLYKTIDNWAVEDIYSVCLPATDKRSAHDATLMVKFGRVHICKPKQHPNDALPDHVEMFAIEVKECTSTVVGKEAPIHWRLLTSHPVYSIEQARMIIQWYQWRWTIEQVFRTLKSKGLQIEDSEVEPYEGLVNLATAGLLAAVKVLQLVQARDGQTKQKLKDVFSEQEIDCLERLNQKLEGKTEKTKNPHPITSLAFAAWVIARLGGWKGYKKSRPPGPITMFRGMVRFYRILEGYYLLL